MAAPPIPTTPHHVGDPSISFYTYTDDDDNEPMKIPPKHLNIVWGGDSRYWKLPDDEESSAELNQVCWLEVTGSVEGTRPNKQYQVGFHVSFTPDAFGWGGSPLYIMVKRGKDGKSVWRKLLLNPDQTKECDITATTNTNTNPHSNDSKLYFGLYEVWSGKWKGGLKIHHAFIRQLP
ncbi:UNVERIFIED_CONTAM: protein PHLOEM PROTEIN 2-LIKE A9 [Sesamum latifolium]|uniref:Protein PHLOEM PROTEIN 2-LIKE A9 n=1 Tax=Sesamum latifolium TaxID=2727402 RepID=A0AAW2TSW4_9LAMI